MKEYFTILFLNETSSLRDVKRAYRILVKRYHPDKNSGSNEFRKQLGDIKEAYDKLLEHFRFRRQSEECHKEAPSESKTKSAEQDYDNPEYISKRKPKKSSENNEKHDSGEKHFSGFEETLDIENKIVRSHSIGDQITVGFFEYTVIKSYFTKTAGNNLFKTEAAGIFLIIEMKVINNTAIRHILHNYMFRLSNTESEFFEFSTKGLAIISMSGFKCIDIFGKDLNPKISAIVNLIFEVPEQSAFFLNLCGGDYDCDENSICHCKEVEVVQIV